MIWVARRSLLFDDLALRAGLLLNISPQSLAQSPVFVAVHFKVF
jgi:hypothetical protein